MDVARHLRHLGSRLTVPTKMALFFVLTVMYGSSASAAPILEITREVYDGLPKYTFVVNHDQNITGFDGGFYGPMNQIWESASKTPTKDTEGGGPDPCDTHFLFFDSEIVPNPPPAEDKDASGCGSYLTGVFGITPGAAAANIQIAQIVAWEAGSTISYNFDVSDNNNAFHFEGSVPEPGTLMLLMLGGLAVLRRPSRQAKTLLRRRRKQ